MIRDEKIILGRAGEKEIGFELKMANRHGLITGATGTGKTTTLKLLAESFSEAGVPVFFSDVKGDLAGMAVRCPVTFWDIFGQNGIPVRTTVSEMGPVLLAKLMDLSPAQSDLLTVAFKIADDQQLLLIDTKDLKAMLQYMSENASELGADYGSIPKVSIQTIIRNIVALEAKGGEQYFAEPALNIGDWFCRGEDGRGMINILDARQLVCDSTMYATFLLWMLSELFETLPEVGDLARPRMAFFFDEAHLLFKDISKALTDKLEQVIKLIRSKGVGVFFISQSPRDIPDAVLAQLGTKIQHGLRAYTPAEEKMVKSVAATFRANPAFDTYETLLNLGIGEALVSALDGSGIPTVVEKVKIDMPCSMKDSLSEEEIRRLVLQSQAYLRYQNMFDRDSAYEFFMRYHEKKKLEDQEAAQSAAAEKEAQAGAKAAEKAKAAKKKKSSKVTSSVAKSAAGTVGREAGKALGSAFGSFGKKLGGNVGATLARSLLGTFLK